MLENVRELWTEMPPGAKKGRPITRDRVISKMFLRGECEPAVRRVCTGMLRIRCRAHPRRIRRPRSPSPAGDSVIIVVAAPETR